MSVVYMTRDLSPRGVLSVFHALGATLSGNVAVKVHSGEKGNQNFIRPEFWQEILSEVGGTVVECNTAYEGRRETTEKHMALLADHGWSLLYPTELLDAEEEMILPIPKGRIIKQNYVGAGIKKYDSALVLSHFKGHPMGGFGGALKQLSIGFASSFGKKYIHGAGDADNFWGSDHDSFLMAMADAAGSVVDYFKGRCVYINVMANLSVDCDCCAKAEDPCMKDIGILASSDPVALDRACLDLIYASKDEGRDHFVERVESRNGALILTAAEALGIGENRYERKDLD